MSGDDPDYDDEDYEPDPDALCNTCGGDGFVDSVAEVTGRHGWDDEGPGDCPDCLGTGKAS